MGKRCIINSETGELLNTLHEGDRILRKSSLDYLGSLVEVNDKRGYVKVYVDSFARMFKEDLSGPEISIVFAIMPYIRFETGLIAHENGRYVSLKNLISMTKLSERAVYGAAEKLVQRKILAKVRTGRDVKLYANPYIFMRGVRVNKTLASMFGNSKYA